MRNKIHIALCKECSIILEKIKLHQGENSPVKVSGRSNIGSTDVDNDPNVFVCASLDAKHSVQIVGEEKEKPPEPQSSSTSSELQ
eukprot:251345-Ditylum_brightwellii.AAC.1